MLQRPTPEQLALLRRAAGTDGFLLDADPDLAERCVAEGWLIAEEATGYALTLDGWGQVRDS